MQLVLLAEAFLDLSCGSAELTYHRADLGEPTLSVGLRGQTELSSVAGAGGIGPTLTVLETVVLPLYDAPIIISDVGVLIILHMTIQTVSVSFRVPVPLLDHDTLRNR